MTAMLRYKWTSFGPILDEDGPFVTFADAEAAIARLAAVSVSQILGSYEDLKASISEAYLQGQRDALADAVKRVEAQIRFWFDVAPDGRLHIHPSDVGEYLFRAAVIAAIKGDLE